MYVHEVCSLLDDQYSGVLLNGNGRRRKKWLDIIGDPVLGYGIMADFKIMSRTWSFLSDTFSSPQRVLDLQMFARMVSH